MKLITRADWLSMAAMLAMFAVAAWAWPQVPERVPTHWNFAGEVDGYGGRFVGLMLLPITTLGVYLLMLAAPLVDPGKLNYENFVRAFSAIRLAFVLFMAALQGVTIRAAFGHPVDMTTFMLFGLGVLFGVIGNFMSKLRPNWFVGVRTPWTLSSRLSWDKTHRLAGWLFMVLGGLMFVVACYQKFWAFVAVLTVGAIFLIWIIAYSYVVYRSDPHRTTPAGTSPIAD